MAALKGIAEAPVYGTDRALLNRRISYDFRDYGFFIPSGLSEIFEIVPTRLDDEEAFMFFFSREDVAAGRWGLFNLHIFLKRTGSLEDFGHSLGASVKDVPFVPVAAFNKPGLGYSRTIRMGDLFNGSEQVVTFIGGEPDRVVRDSHFYFMHHHAHCYTGVLHPVGEDARYDALRRVIFSSVTFDD